MSNLRKLGVVIWKNFLFRRRHYFVTIFELIVPTLFSLLLVVLRKSGGNLFQVTLHEDVTHFDPRPIYPPPVSIPMKSILTREVLVLFTPDLNSTRFLTEPLADIALRHQMKTVVVKGVKDRDAINKLVLEASVDDHLFEIFAAIEFVSVDPEREVLPDKLHYRIRIGDEYMWNTDLLIRPIDVPGPPLETRYLRSFAAIQHVIAVRFMEMMSGKSNLTTNSVFMAQAFPYPPYYEDSGFSIIMEIILPLFITLSYIFISPSLIKRIVREKELGVKELLKLMGVPGWIQWIGWFLSSFIMMTISAIVIVALLCYQSSSNMAVLNHSAPELLLFIFMLYISSAICFCFFITSFFSKPTLATAIGVLAWLLSFCVPYYSLYTRYSKMSFSAKMATCLLPNMAMAWGVRITAGLEGRNVGIQWSNIADPSYKGDDFSVGCVLFMMVVDIFLYSFLTWYLDHVYPGVYGVPKPWYFLFMKSYWFGSKTASVKATLKNEPTNAINFEEEPIGLSPMIVIQNLSKSYGWGKESKMAVENVSLNMYEGQITALLGHNGAGKTTTMSILSGMFPPSSGSAIINGYDIRTEIDTARKDIGLCPQHNMLFDLLTVKETLLLFGKIKAPGGKELEDEVKILMEKLQLYEKRDVFAGNLSGGMQRKLNLGISLVGGSKVVMLDEPTSGMDPEARRAIWDLLQDLRQGRCIVLTTHFMEEADVLGDRIAIMANGKIECCGTPLFLKKRYGAGYHLNITKTETCEIAGLSNLISHYIPSSYLDNNASMEMSFILPSETTSSFRALFEELENKMEPLGISNFGLSVTTMEEVFLKVGEETSTEAQENSQLQQTELLLDPENGPKFVQKATGLMLGLLRFAGLCLKRMYYAKRRWILLIAQIIIPAAVILIFLLLNNNIGVYDQEEVPLIMDISQYGKSTAFYSYNTKRPDFLDLSEKYKTSLSPTTTVNNVSDPLEYLEDLGKNNFQSYSEFHVVGAEFKYLSGNDLPLNFNVWYNGLYYHSLPLSLNLMHNAMLKHYTKSERYSLVVENAPLPYYDVHHYSLRGNIALMRSVIMGVFIPIGVSFLSSSFVVLPIHEKATRSKHLQLMTGVSSALFWLANFVWDFLTHIVSSIIILIVFLTVDRTGIFTQDSSGWVFLLLTLYGWCAIPFTYLISFVFRVPATGFTCLTVINLIAGIILSLWLFILQMSQGSLLGQWFAFLLPNYTITIAFMKVVQIAVMNSACSEIDSNVFEVLCKLQPDKIPPNAKMCCKNACGDSCFRATSYSQWEFPGMGKEITMLFVDGCIFFLIILVIESSFVHKIWAIVVMRFTKRLEKRTEELATDVSTLDEDVIAEKEYVENLISNGISDEGENILIVHDLYKRFGKLYAVDHLNFSVKNAECFGLLGVNGAGKTTTFKMLTGDSIPSGGNAIIKGVSVIDNHSKFLSQIGYCPQFDALLDYLTGREMLSVFSYLWGIKPKDVVTTVNQFLTKFDLTQHADKITLAYSGGNKRKLSTALAFIGNPPVLCLDEPTTGVDPMARRKMWTIISDANIDGTSVVLTSHSMEECEVLCSRIAIMVNGQFQCLGGNQYLKNKFSQGFTILAKLRRTEEDERQKGIQKELQEFVSSQLPGATLKDVHQGLVHYHVSDVDTKWTRLFGVMEEAKERFNLEDYSVSQATLEQLFLSFARKQRTSMNNEMK